MLWGYNNLMRVPLPYVHGDITAILAANLAFEFLSLQAIKKASK